MVVASCDLSETLNIRWGWSDRETFTARAVRDCVRIGDFETTLLEVLAVIEHRAADEKCALWIDDQSDILRWHENVALLRSIDQIHNVLQTRATAADHFEAQRTFGLAFFFKQRR